MAASTITDLLAAQIERRKAATRAMGRLAFSREFDVEEATRLHSDRWDAQRKVQALRALAKSNVDLRELGLCD